MKKILLFIFASVSSLMIVASGCGNTERSDSDFADLFTTTTGQQADTFNRNIAGLVDVPQTSTSLLQPLYAEDNVADILSDKDISEDNVSNLFADLTESSLSNNEEHCRDFSVSYRIRTELLTAVIEGAKTENWLTNFSRNKCHIDYIVDISESCRLGECSTSEKECRDLETSANISVQMVTDSITFTSKNLKNYRCQVNLLYVIE